MKNKTNNALSPVMGIIITILIVIAAASSLYFYIHLNAEDIGKSDTAYIPLTGSAIHNTKNATVNVDSSSKNKVSWNEVYWYLVDITEAKNLEDGIDVVVTFPEGNITSGNLISIKTSGGDYLKDKHKYRFTLYHSKNSIVLGNTEWKQ